MLLENSNVSVADVAVGSTGTAITASFVFWADNPAPPVLTYAVPAATFILPISSASAKVSDFSPEYFEKSQVVVLSLFSHVPASTTTPESAVLSSALVLVILPGMRAATIRTAMNNDAILLILRFFINFIIILLKYICTR